MTSEGDLAWNFGAFRRADVDGIDRLAQTPKDA